MRRVVTVLLAGVLAACAPTVQDQSARMRAFQADLDGAMAEWQGRVGQKYYPSSVAATQDLLARYEEVYGRWGQTVDPLSQALMSYSLAVAERVDRGQITADAANKLLTAMKTDIDREKQRLASVPDATAGHDAAMLTWWSNYWNMNRAHFAASAQRPIVCQTAPAAGERPRVRCV
jgi:hypothetical protein